MVTSLLTVNEKPKGVVDPATARQMFRLERYQPSAALAAILDHYWIVEWDLRGKPPYVQRTLPYPCAHLVFDQGRTAVWGVSSGSFEYTLKDAGRVLGVRFRPGAFRAFLQAPMHSITDKTVSLAATLGYDDSEAERLVLAAADDAGLVAAAESLLLACLPAPDPKVERVNTLLKLIQQHSEVTRVEDWAAQGGIGMRALQQLFSDYVGVSPKWVIRRYRLQEAADLLASGNALDLAELAQALGYFDQAHLSKDFHQLVGKTPSEYRRQAGA